MKEEKEKKQNGWGFELGKEEDNTERVRKRK